MWHQGYTSEVNYTYGYYNELSPTRIRLALLTCGIDHSISDNPTYLELGFGQGLSLAINAATSSGCCSARSPKVNRPVANGRPPTQPTLPWSLLPADWATPAIRLR